MLWLNDACEIHNQINVHGGYQQEKWLHLKIRGSWHKFHGVKLQTQNLFIQSPIN